MDLELRTCLHCSKPFVPNRWWTKYCSRACNQAAYYARRYPIGKHLLDAEILDPTPPSGPTPVQEDEHTRRKEGSPPEQPPSISEQDLVEAARKREIGRKAQEAFYQKYGTTPEEKKVYSNVVDKIVDEDKPE